MIVQAISIAVTNVHRPRKAGTPEHRIAGNGPPLLLIHGSGGDLNSYAQIETLLGQSFSVISYQRRFGTADVATASSLQLTLDDHVNDALEVLRACDADAAYVLGSSAGAVIGMSLLTAYPSKVLELVAHEPPALAVLEEGETLRKKFAQVLSMEAKKGVQAACAAFFDLTGILGEAGGPTTEQVSKAVAARTVPPIREIHPILDYVPDLVALHSQRDKLVLATGELHLNSMPARATVALAKLLGRAPVTFPGNHFGYMNFAEQNDPEHFGELIVQTFARQDRSEA
jgi:pimeloyl-ACP methyl ester carboxylesterase